MAVRFSFVMSDVDAENLVGCFYDCINQANVGIIKEMAKKKPNKKMIRWYEKHIEYLEGLKEVVCKGSSREKEKKGKKR